MNTTFQDVLYNNIFKKTNKERNMLQKINVRENKGQSRDTGNMGQQTRATWDSRHMQYGTADTKQHGTTDTGNIGQHTGNMRQQTQAIWNSRHRQHGTTYTGNMGQQTRQHGTTDTRQHGTTETGNMGQQT
jgi:hypothetical protein